MSILIILPSEVLIEIFLYVSLLSESEGSLDISMEEDDAHSSVRNIARLVRNYSNLKVLTGSFVTGIEAIHDWQGADIYELYDSICCHRSSRQALLDLSLTCKRLHQLAEPFIWSMIEMPQESRSPIATGNLVRFLFTILKRPELGHHVKALSFEYDEVDNESANPFCEADKKTMANILDWDDTQQVSALLNHLPNLQSLKLMVDNVPAYFSVFKPSPIHPSPFPPALQNLSELSFHWAFPSASTIPASTLISLFLLPNLKTLYLGNPMASADESDLPSDFTRFIKTSKITTLILEFSTISPPFMTSLLALPSALENFTYTYPISTTTLIESYYTALLPHCTSLKHLTIRRSPDLESSDDDLAPDPATLKSFLALTSFSCPISLLLFRPDGAQNYKLASVLPPNIEELTLFAYDEWTFESLCEEIKNFLSLGKKGYPNLKRLRAECWLKEEDYVLYGERGGKKEDTLGVMGWRVDGLKRRGADKGVRVEVELRS